MMLLYYQELILIPHEDIDLYFIWHKLFQQIHLALADNKTIEGKSHIGAGFPEYDAENYCLGKRLHLFAGDDTFLKKMNCEKWLNRLMDYVHIQPIKPVPKTINGYACFKHIKLKGNKEKLARRRAKRMGETLQQALVHFENYQNQHNKLPYINMISQTNGHRFRLIIEKQAMKNHQEGIFSCYGLSGTATVPLF